MKLECLYLKEYLDDSAKILSSVKTAHSLMTAGEREAENRAGVARFQEIWAAEKSRSGRRDEQAIEIYQQLIHETQAVARDCSMDMKAEWSTDSGWIELACDMLFTENTANPLHLHLGRLFEHCNSYSFMSTHRYGRELAALTFHFSFILYPFLNEEDESDWE